MAFYLIMQNNRERCFDIITKEEWESFAKSDIFTVVESGDEAYLNKMKRQLQGEAWVRGDIEQLQSSPIFKIARVVSCTSSGNTKFSNSPTITDPYQTDSGQEYFPNEEESSSSEDYSVEDDRLIRRKVSGIKNIKRVINFDDPSSVVSSTSRETNFEISPCDTAERSSDFASVPTTSTSTMTSLTSGEVTISNNNQYITLDFYVTLHSDTFSVPLEKVLSTKSTCNILKGALPLQEKKPGHKCHPVDSRKPIGYALKQTEEYSIVITLDRCVQRGSAQGIFVFINESNTHTAVLRFNDPLLGVDEEKTLFHNVEEPSTKMKTHFCLYCKKRKTCIGRHYLRQHAKEDLVKEIIEAKKSGETKEKVTKLMANLRQMADLEHNKTVKSYHDRIPKRKHNIQMLSNSVHCPSCYALVAGRNFTRHDRFCTARPADKRRRLRYLQIQERIDMSSENEDERTFLSVVNNMTKDHLKEIIERDPLAKSLAIFLVKSQPKTHNLDNVRQQLRRTARLFVEVQKVNEEVEELKDMFKPLLYSTVMSCIRKICCFNEPLEKRKSQLALAYGPLISSLINRLHIELLKSGVSQNDARLEELNNLLKIHQEEFKVEITRQALMSSKHKRMAKRSSLPSTSDIQKLMEYTRQVGDRHYEHLKTAFELNDWIELGKSLLCQLLVFNRRRVGEMSRARVEDFKNRQQVSPEYFESLNRLEIILAEEFSIFTIMAKRTRPVNLLVTKAQVEQLDLLISMRKQAGIPDDNTYLFATTTQAEGYLKASNVLRSFASQCGASNSSLLKSTNLRKHVATMSQMFCLNDNEMKQLADFLGHDRDVHEKFYRLNESNSQITRLSKFLCTVGDKNVFQHRGKTIDELPFDTSGYDAKDASDGVDESTEEEEEEEEKSEEVHAQPESLPCSSSMVNAKKVKSKTYVLRKRSGLKAPLKLQTPTKKTPQACSPAKSPFTTSQLLNMVAVPKAAKKLRWTEKEKAVMETEFAENLQNKTLPSLAMCDQVKMRNFNELKQRDVHSIYCWVRNNLRKK